MKYVCGFAFSQDERSVLLIEKIKPAWQAGLHNGIGGKIEPDETPIDAMVREMREETGLVTTADSWDHFCLLRGQDWEVHFYRMFSDEIFLARTIETEEVMTYRVDDLPATIPNLSFLIPMALSRDVHGVIENRQP